MRTRICALILIMLASACTEEPTVIAYEIHEPDPPEPVYELAVSMADRSFPQRIVAPEGEALELPFHSSIGLGVESAGDLVQICAIARGEEGRLLGAVSDRVPLVAEKTVRVSMRLAALADESEVPPQCTGALGDAGPPDLL
jgi:hypothetical protein